MSTPPSGAPPDGCEPPVTPCTDPSAATASTPAGSGLDEPFHAGERALQARAGLHERMAELGRKLIRDSMPDQHRELFAKLPFVVLGSLDDRGRPWASLLAGLPGFLSSPNPRALRLDALPHAGDPLARQLAPGAPLGLLGIELPTRRRNRMNGRVAEVDARGFAVRVEQSFGNCPQYIQSRAPERIQAPTTVVRATPEGATLSPRAQGLIAAADTFFIATAANGGADVSHRGGRSGFVRVQSFNGRTVLTAPDFRGNYFFNTLGNIASHPHAGLLFVDFERGDLLSLTATATIVWDGPEVDAYAGAQRLVRVEVEEGLWLEGALPWRWSAPEPAAQLDLTGVWPPT